MFDTNKSIPLFIENSTLDYKNLKKDIEVKQKDEVNKKVVFNNLTDRIKFLYRFLQFLILMGVINFILMLLSNRDPDFSFFLLIIPIIGFSILYFYTQYSHMSFKINDIDLKNGVEINKIFTGNIEQDLSDLKIQVLLINSENGAYERSNGSRTRTVYFTEEISNKLIFEKNLGLVNKGTSLENLLSGAILKLDNLGNNLFNSISIGYANDFGLFTYLEIRVINSVYKDISIKKIIYLDESLEFKEEGFNI